MKRPTSPDETGDKRQKTETKENNDKNDCLMDVGDNDDNIRYQLRSSSQDIDKKSTVEGPKQQQAPPVSPTKKRKGKQHHNRANATRRRRLQLQARVLPQSGADQPRVECPAVPNAAGDNSLVDKQTGDRSLVDKRTGDRSLVDKRTGDRSLVDKQTGDRSLVDKRTGDRSLVDKQTGDRSLVDKGTGDRSLVDKQTGDRSLVDKGELTTTEDSLVVRFKQQSHDITSECEGSDAAGTFWSRLGWKFLSWISGVSQSVWLVPDTNFFMQDKAIMQGIKNKLTAKLGSAFYIGISYTVVKELDAIKNDRSNKRTVEERYMARQAIILLCQWFDNDDACVKGENPYETAYVRSKMAFPPQITNNDDQISEWCLQLRVKYGQSVVALLSEDRGFRVKANLHGLKAFSIVMLTDWLSSSSSSF